MVAVIGATGNTGKVVAETLLARGQKVRVIGRDPERLVPQVRKGAEAWVGEASDAAALTKAFAGARAVYVMIPPNLASPDMRAYQEKVSDAQAQAIAQTGVEYAVLLSSVGADKPEKTGPVLGLRLFEEKLNGNSRLNALYIRAGYFMENLLAQVTVIKNFGIVGGPLRADRDVRGPQNLRARPVAEEPGEPQHRAAAFSGAGADSGRGAECHRRRA